MAPQWDVTVTDNHGHDHLIGVAARSESEACRKGRDYFNRGAASGTWAVAAKAVRR